MPHQCVRCGTFYNDGAKEILSGCNCGGKLFFFIKKSRLEEAKRVRVPLDIEEKKQVEKDVFDIVGANINQDNPIVLDFESIRVLKPGQYEIDLVKVFKENPLIYKLEEGKYMIDIPETFKRMSK